MVIGGRLIKLFLKAGWIYCNPAPVMITENSLDITLGSNFWRLKDDLCCVNPEAPALEQFDLVTYQSGAVMSLDPGRLLLAHTHEFVGSTVPWLVPQIRTRSTAARWGIECGTSALLGEGNFHSRWTLEMVNTTHLPVQQRVGWRVGQIFFSLCLGGGMYKRQYNQPEGLWTPETMLPKRMQ